MLISYSLSYSKLIKRGPKIGIRGKVNDSVITGIRLVDALIPIGKGQRQLILGDRGCGKSSIYMSLVINSIIGNCLGSHEGWGSDRLYGIYCSINQSLSKLSYILNVISFDIICDSDLVILNFSFISYFLFPCCFISILMDKSDNDVMGYNVFIATHNSSCAILSVLCPYVGITIAERIRDRGYDSIICLDDLSKHAKSYRQMSLILGKIPSRDAYPSDVFNVHSSLLERSGKINNRLGGGSVTAFPIIETSNCDITEYIATNIISITDGQLYLDKKLFQSGIRPAIDSALSVSRIGSSAQCSTVKTVTNSLKNEYTLLMSSNSSSSIICNSLISLTHIFFQSHLFPSNLNCTTSLLIAYRNHICFNSIFSCSVFNSIYTHYSITLIYLLYLIRTNYSLLSFLLISYIFSNLSYLFNSNHYSLANIAPYSPLLDTIHSSISPARSSSSSITYF